MRSLAKTTGHLFLLFVLLMMSQACHNYYKTLSAKKTTPQETAQSIDSLHNQNRYFILRSGSTSWAVTKMTLSTDQKTISCVLDTISSDHRLHLTLGHKRKMQYKKQVKQDLSVLNEVHLFIPPDNTVQQGSYILSLDKVHKIEVIVHDKKRTTDSYVVGAIGYSLGAAVVVAIIVAATKSSCPFVSAYDGTQFSLQGEIYGGAIYPQLERHDYLPLKMALLRDGTLQLKITNELQERQYTDMAELLVIDHDKTSKILTDEKGDIYTISNQQLPLTASLGNGKNVLSALARPNDNEILYMDDSSRTDAKNEVTLKFSNLRYATHGKLVLTLKNSYFLDLLYGEVAKGFGTYYASYMNKQKTRTANELMKWVREQQIPLEVSIKSTTGWTKITDITTIGPLANREIIVPVKITPSADGIAEIKLSAGFMFWEIDHASIDFSDNSSFAVQKLKPQKATDEKGSDVLATLLNEDGIYLEQPEIGNSVNIVYTPSSSPDPSKTRTYILHAKGYYEHIRNFKNKPDVSFLTGFTKPNALPVFGMQLYKKLQKESLKSMATAD